MNTLNGFPLKAAANRTRFRRDAIEELANSFCCTAGRTPSKGWALLRRGDFTQLNSYSTSLQLDLGGIVLKNLSIVQARCVTRGIASDPEALYLVELTDLRGVLYNKWFQMPTVSNYNIRTPAYPQTFYPDTLNSGTTWTWATMVGNLWSQLGLGSFPGLPATPIGTPEGFWLFGTSAWVALNDILDLLGMKIAVDPTAASPFTIVADSATDAIYSALATQYSSRLEDDLEWLDTGAARVPKYVKVLFKRRNSIYGTEETVRYGSEQWAMQPFYGVTVTVDSAAVGTHYLWPDFTVRYDHDNTPLAVDVATATAIATERATQYYNRITGKSTRRYSGALPFATGSLVDRVTWAMSERQGWRTTVERGVL